MGFRVNPDRWMPMGDYIRFVLYTLTHKARINQFNEDQTEWQRRWSKVLVTDGPIHTLWVRGTQVRYNWFTIALRCRIKKHTYGYQTICLAPDTEFVSDTPGVLRSVKTGKTRRYKVSVCTYCGRYQGMNYDVLER
jgi:hypothetical protein